MLEWFVTLPSPLGVRDITVGQLIDIDDIGFLFEEACNEEWEVSYLVPCLSHCSLLVWWSEGELDDGREPTFTPGH